MKNTTSLYRLEIAPLLILPLTRSPFFSYASTTPIALGSLVSISFGSQTVEGVVFDCQVLPGKKPLWMKSISHIIEPSALTPAQRELAIRVSTEYFTPLGRTLKHFLPKKVQERARAEATLSKPKLLRATKHEQQLVKFFSGSKLSVPCFLDTSAFAEPKRILALIAKAMVTEKKQTLIIIPEIILTFGLAHFFQTYFAAERIAILHSKLSDGAFSTLWERIRSGEASVIIATRQGLFAPFRALGTIIITEEQDESYKQWDMSPRYHGKKVAQFLSELTTARLLLTSGTPSVSTLHEIHEKKLLPLEPLANHEPLIPRLSIVNLKLERYRRNFSPLSEELALALRDAVDRGEQALLYINRQGMNAFSVCEKCKEVFRCKECDHPLTSTKEGHFRCVSCGYTTALFPNCPTCGHLTFRHVGFGTERIEKEVHKLLPKARIVRLDSTTLKTPKILQTTFLAGQNNEIDILIGTQMILKDPPLPKLSLIAMIDADSVLLFPDFQADERLFRDLSRAVRQVSGQPKGRVFVQTFRPEGAFFQKIAGKKSKDVLEYLLSERSDLSYPPLYRFLSISCHSKSEKEATTVSTRLAREMEKILPKEYRLTTARASSYLKKKTTYESLLLLRFPAGAPLADSVTSLLRKYSKDCIVDIDPLTLR